MLDLEKDIALKVRVREEGKRKAWVDIIIGDLIKINGFQIIQSKNGKLLVINPHTTSVVENKVKFRKEISYIAVASLLEHKDRKVLVDMMLKAYADAIDALNQATKGKKIENKTLGGGMRHKIYIDERGE